ncbi:MAG: class I SAM-dependent RNA methyltransferase [Acidimicrobiales bacterium]
MERARGASKPGKALHEGYAVCAPGVEPLLAAELAPLGVRAIKGERGGVSFRATTRQLYAANLWSRLATRVLVRVGTFEANTFAELQRHATELDLERWLGDRPPYLRVSSQRSALYHTDAIAERLHGVWGPPPEPPEPVTRRVGVAGTDRVESGTADGKPDGRPAPTPDGDELGDGPAGQLLVVRNVANRFTVSVDLSGAPLYQRGWRQEVGKAPLRENAAAAMLAAVGWQAPQPLLDPFCGSGTIVIEAALAALGRPPGFLRGFAFFDWPIFEPGTWASVIGQAVDAERDPEGLGLQLVGSDRDAGVVVAAAANAERAAVAEWVTFEQRSVSDLPPWPGGGDRGWVLTNPPWGTRVSASRDLRNLYARFGDVLRTAVPTWSVGLLCADRHLAAHSGLSLQERLRFSAGGIDVALLTGRVGAATSGRRRPAGPRQPST